MAVPLQFFNCARSNPRFNGDFGTLASSLAQAIWEQRPAETAISTGHQILRPHETGEAADALSHQFRMPLKLAKRAASAPALSAAYLWSRSYRGLSD